MDEEYVEEIALNPFLTLDEYVHRRSRKAAFLQALDDLLDEYDDLTLFLIGLPLLLLAELWRDDPPGTTGGSSYTLSSILTSIVLYLYRLFNVLASITPLLLFIVSTTPELLAQQATRLQVYRGPSITDFLPQEVIDNIIDHLVPDHEHDHLICGSTHDKYERSQFLRAFSSYSLVCSAFARRSQFHLFSTLVIRSSSPTDLFEMNISEDDNTRGQQLRSVEQFVEKKPQLSKHTRFIQVAPIPLAYMNSRSDEHAKIQAVLRALHGRSVRVQVLCLGFNHRELRPWNDLGVINFPQSFISMFPSLRSLSLSDFRTSDHPVSQDVCAPDAPAMPQLHSLALKLASRELLRMMGMVRAANSSFSTSTAAFLNLSKLAHCHVDWTNDEDQSAASSVVVKTFGTTITHFSYQFRCLPEFADENFVNLAHLPALEELTILFEPIWGMHLNRTRLARTRRAVCTPTPSIDFLPWFLGNLHPEVPLRTLNITCPRMTFFTGDPDPANLILSLEWPRLDAELRRIYENIVAHNPASRSRTRLTVNLSLSIPLRFPGGVSYKNGTETKRAARLRWTEKAARKCRRAMRTTLRHQFPLTLGCPGIDLNIFYSLDIATYPETRYGGVDNPFELI